MKTSAFLFFLVSIVCCSIGRSVSSVAADDSFASILGSAGFGSLSTGNLLDVQSSRAGHYGAQTTLVLAGNRTKRPDVLRRFRRYHGGWDIRNKHYWASVGFTGAPWFTLAMLWFVCFPIAIVVYRHCGCRIQIKDNKRYKHYQRICILLLVLFTCGSVTGCILLSVGQDEFHDEVLQTVNYVVNQSDYTVQMLKNVTDYLSLAKTINLSLFSLPSDIEKEIADLSVGLTSDAEILTVKTRENSAIIRRVFSSLRSSLIAVASVMLVVVLVGLVLSLLGYQNAIHLFILSGWLLVAVTLILCGVFMVLDNAVVDSCTAMKEWASNPQAETTLSDILPCVDERDTNQTLIQSKKVVVGIANVINQFIYTYADTNRSVGDMFYYNQSGPIVPPLCEPFDYQLQDRECGSWEVSMDNAPAVWERYICQASRNYQICETTGRLTPLMYSKLVTAVNASYALKHYTPLVLNLENCNFVRDVFMNITSSFCPGLEHYLVSMIAGLGLISAGVMLCLIFWMLNANRPEGRKCLLSLPCQ